MLHVTAPVGPAFFPASAEQLERRARSGSPGIVLRVVDDRMYEPAAAQFVREVCAHFILKWLKPALIASFVSRAIFSSEYPGGRKESMRQRERSRLSRGARNRRCDLAILQTSRRLSIFVIEHAGPFCFENLMSIIRYDHISNIPERGRLDHLLLEREEQAGHLSLRTLMYRVDVYKHFPEGHLAGP
jgi:hypothetical protein